MVINIQFRLSRSRVAFGEGDRSNPGIWMAAAAMHIVRSSIAAVEDRGHRGQASQLVLRTHMRSWLLSAYRDRPYFVHDAGWDLSVTLTARHLRRRLAKGPARCNRGAERIPVVWVRLMRRMRAASVASNILATNEPDRHLG